MPGLYVAAVTARDRLTSYQRVGVKSRSKQSRVPWHVKGVRPNAREVARDAARRSGLSVGEWLNSLIIDAAANANPFGEEREAGPIDPPPRRHGRHGRGRPMPTRALPRRDATADRRSGAVTGVRRRGRHRCPAAAGARPRETRAGRRPPIPTRRPDRPARLGAAMPSPIAALQTTMAPTCVAAIREIRAAVRGMMVSTPRSPRSRRVSACSISRTGRSPKARRPAPSWPRPTRQGSSSSFATSPDGSRPSRPRRGPRTVPRAPAPSSRLCRNRRSTPSTRNSAG